MAAHNRGLRARFYSTKLGRFLSPDPLVSGMGPLTVNLALRYTPKVGAALNPQSLDRYSYVLNNPLRYTDPTGLLTQDEWAALAAAGDRLREAGVPEDHIVPFMLSVAQFQQSSSFVPTGSPTPTPIPAGSKWYGGVGWNIQGYVPVAGVGGSATVRVIYRNGRLLLQISGTLGGGATTGGVFTGPVVGVGRGPENASGPIAVGGGCAAWGLGGCACFEGSEGGWGIEGGPAVGVGPAGGAAVSAMGQGGYQVEVDLGDAAGWLGDRLADAWSGLTGW